MTPTTEAGRALAEDYPGLLGLEYGRTGEPIIAAIEQEAVRAYKAELAAQIAALTPPGGRFQNPDGSYTLVIGSVSDYRAAVLALLDEPVP